MNKKAKAPCIMYHKGVNFIVSNISELQIWPCGAVHGTLGLIIKPAPSPPLDHALNNRAERSGEKTNKPLLTSGADRERYTQLSRSDQ